MTDIVIWAVVVLFVLVLATVELIRRLKRKEPFLRVAWRWLVEVLSMMFSA